MPKIHTLGRHPDVWILFITANRKGWCKPWNPTKP
nr:MAG TPA: hypothetical protein [Caudoviricetes sp.]